VHARAHLHFQQVVREGVGHALGNQHRRLADAGFPSHHPYGNARRRRRGLHAGARSDAGRGVTMTRAERCRCHSSHLRSVSCMRVVDGTFAHVVPEVLPVRVSKPDKKFHASAIFSCKFGPFLACRRARATRFFEIFGEDGIPIFSPGRRTPLKNPFYKP